MELTKAVLVWITLFCISSRLVVCGSGGESVLLERLLMNYSVNERPVKNYNDAIGVTVDLGLKQIINMDEKKQVLVWNAWVRQYWKDIHLGWNASKEGVKSLVVSKENIWVPDLAVYNNAKDGFQLVSDEAEEKIILDNNGNCIWMTPLVIKTTCMLDVTYFPFDSQICTFEVGSWAYTGDMLNISHQKIPDPVEGYTVNGVWDVQDISATLKVGYYACCVEPYPSVIYTLSLRRRSRFYLLNFFVPSGWIALLATISFCLPHTSGERVTLLITNLLSLAFFIMILSNIVPPTSTFTPLLEIYLTAIFIEICLALVARSFIDKTKRRYKRPGIVTRTIVNKFLAKLLLVTPQSVENRPQTRQFPSSSVELENIQVRLSPNASRKAIRNHGREDANTNEQGEITLSDSQPDRGCVKDRMLSSLREISESVDETCKLRENQRNLNCFILNLDDFFFWLFNLILFLTLLVFFLTPPQIKM